MPSTLEKEAGTATKTDPEKWEQAKADAKARMGGKHSARAMQLATQLYKKRGGGYSGEKPTAKNNSLKKWGKQKWQWSGGEKKKKTAAVEQGGRGVYLPEAKIKRLKATKEGKKRLAAAAAKKSKATREGKQYSSHGLAAGTSLESKGKKKEAKQKLAGHLMHLMGGNEDAMMLCKVLDSTAAQAIELKKKIKMGKKLPSWAEYKVYKAGDSIKSALSSTYTMADHMPKITIGIRTMPSMSSPLHKTAADDREERNRKLKRLATALAGGTGGGALGYATGIAVPGIASLSLGAQRPVAARIAERLIPYGGWGGGLLGTALGATALSGMYAKKKYYRDKKRKEIIREALAKHGLAKHGGAKKELKVIAKELHKASKMHKSQAKRIESLMKKASTDTRPRMFARMSR